MVSDTPAVYVKTFNLETYSQIWSAGIMGITPAAALTTQTDHWDVLPSYSPDGTQIVFLRLNLLTSFVYELWVMNSDGSGETQLDDGGGVDNCKAAMWHPDGSVILYRVDLGGGSNEFYTIEPDGTNKTLVYSGTSIFRPTYNFDGSRIAFLKSGTPEELWAMDSDGTNDSQIDSLSDTSLVAVGIAPANAEDVWAYVTGSSSSDDMRRINGDGSGEADISTNAVLDRPIVMRKAWAADDSLVFCARGGGAPWELWSVDPNGTPGSSETDLNVSMDADDGQVPFVYGERIVLVRNTGVLVSVDYAGGDEITMDTPAVNDTVEMQFDSGL